MCGASDYHDYRYVYVPSGILVDRVKSTGVKRAGYSECVVAADAHSVLVVAVLVRLAGPSTAIVPLIQIGTIVALDMELFGFALDMDMELFGVALVALDMELFGVNLTCYWGSISVFSNPFLRHLILLPLSAQYHRHDRRQYYYQSHREGLFPCRPPISPRNDKVRSLPSVHPE